MNLTGRAEAYCRFFLFAACLKPRVFSMATAFIPRCSNLCPFCSEAASRDTSCSEADFEAIPDEIDLLQVMQASIKGGCNQRLPAWTCHSFQ